MRIRAPFWLKSPVSQLPRSASFLNTVRIINEPRGMLGRLFLILDENLWQMGVVARPCTSDELVKIYEVNASTWKGLAEVFDPRVGPILPGTAFCMAAFDAQGDAIATGAARLIDTGTKTLKQSFEDLTFWYGANADAMQQRAKVTVADVPGSDCRGQIMYPGAVWVRPDHRGKRIAQMMADLVRYSALGLWPVDYETSVGSPRFGDPRVRETYQFEKNERGVIIYREGVLRLDGYLLTSSRDHLVKRLEALITFEEGSAASPDVRRRQDGIAS
jgi:hypothetical protein